MSLLEQYCHSSAKTHQQLSTVLFADVSHTPGPQMAQAVGNRYTKNPVFNRSQNRRERRADTACHTIGW